ncbi:MAG: SPOR domain-containing protein [Desulfomonile sp.]|jgi:cell division septation protein DedD
MGLGRLLPKKWQPNFRKRSIRRSVNEDSAPKNGWLVLAVGASVIVMIGLVIADVRLIRDPAMAGKIFQRSVSSEPRTSMKAQPLRSAPGSDETSCYVPPEVTFYTKLSAQDESSGDARDAASEKYHETDVDPGKKQSVKGFEAEKKRVASSDRVASYNISDYTSSGKSNLPEPEKGARTYAVQVGAFTHPAIAQEWALKWKARGYDVALKPVARPRTGVIYRLYLGNFLSEKKADELVNHLKSKEGISAFPVVLRN